MWRGVTLGSTLLAAAAVSSTRAWAGPPGTALAAGLVTAVHTGAPHRCDAVFIDGSKTYEGRLAEINHVRNASRTGAMVFLDEISTRECVDGSLPLDEYRAKCKPLSGFWEATRAYDTASRRGILSVLECTWTPQYKGSDGIGIPMHGSLFVK